MNKFSHVAKTSIEKDDYLNKVVGTRGDYSEAVFEDTSSEKKASEPELVKKTPNKPYKSPKTKVNNFFKKHLITIITIIVVPIIFWVIQQVIGYGQDISALKENKNYVESSLNDLKNKYESINSKSIRSEVILEEIRKDLEGITSTRGN